MKYFLRFLCLCLIVLPLTIHAELTGKVISRYPGNPNELWISDVNDISKTRRICKFKQEHIIRHLSVQKNGPFIVVAAHQDANTEKHDVSLLIQISLI